MSLKWIQENLEAPTCDEECSDIENSGTDDSYDLDLLDENGISEKTGSNDKIVGGKNIEKRETVRHPTTTVTFTENGTPVFHDANQVNKEPYELRDPSKCIQNPAYNCKLITLLCRTGYYLTVSSAGRVHGEIEVSDQIAPFRVITVSSGIVQLQNSTSGYYVAFNKKGHLYGELKGNKDNTEWEQWSLGSFEAFRSRKYAIEGWWLGIKKNGRSKAGPKTAWGQKAIQFSVLGID